MPLSAARLALPLAVLALIAGFAGCGSSETDQPELKISFQAPTSGPLKQRAADIRRAAQLELDAIGGDAAGRRIKLVDGADTDAIVAINALSMVSQQAPDQLLISLIPPGRREVSRARGARGIDAPSIDLPPPASLAEAAKLDYAASGVPGSKKAEIDDPLVPGTPKGRYVTAALSAHSYPPAGTAFFKKFDEQYDRAPDRWAIYGYEAVGLVVDAMTRAEDAGLPITQKNVAQQALAIRNRYSPLGHYDVLPSGQTTLYIFQARGRGTSDGPASLIEALR